MLEFGLLIGISFLTLRIILLGAERIFLSKNKLGKYDSVLIASLFFLVASLMLIPGLLLVPLSVYNMHTLLPIRFSLFSSLFYSVGFYSYVKALSMEDASLIAPLYNSSLLWLFLLSSIYLPGSVTLTRVTGGLIMFIGFFFLYSGSLKEKLVKIKSSNASILMIVGSMFLAIGRVIDASVIAQTNEFLYAISINFFVGIYLFFITLFAHREKINSLKNLSSDKKNLLFAGICNGWSYLFLLIAILYLQVTVAEPASLLSVLVTAYLAKKYLGENIKERIPGIVIILIGSLLLFVDKI